MPLIGVDFGEAQITGPVNINGVTVGITAENLVEVLEGKGLLRTAETAGLERRVVIMLAKRLKPDEALDFDQALTELERAVSVALRIIERGEQGADQDAFVNTVLQRVAQRTKDGDLEGGVSEINQALAGLDASYQRQKIKLLEQSIQLHTLRQDAAAVARHVELIIATEFPGSLTSWLPEFAQKYFSYIADGSQFGVNFSLSVAVELALRMVETAREDEELGFAFLCFGDALQRRAELDRNGVQQFEMAAEAYRAALKYKTRERVPQEWAATKNCLGNVLTKVGTIERKREPVEEAVANYCAALEVNTRESASSDWAMTQNNLGNALAELGTWWDAKWLNEAIVSYRAVLEVVTRESAPLDWAMLQINLGQTLQRLGLHNDDRTLKEEAVIAIRAGVSETTRKQGAVPWAAAQYALGGALMTLGDETNSPAHFEEAVEAYRSALEVRTRERMPFTWAATMYNLGTALQWLGEREVNATRLEEAVEIYRMTLEESSQAGELSLVGVLYGLGTALQKLGEQESGTARLKEAANTLKSCLSIAKRNWSPGSVKQVRERQAEVRSEIRRRSTKSKSQAGSSSATLARPPSSRAKR